VNPINGVKVPIFAGNFVLADYGSGMVMAVPAHDQRDFEFAKKYGLEIKKVIEGAINKKAYTGEGKLINSGKFNGINNKKAITEITNYLTKKKVGKKTINFRLRDWLISRQRYWGTPIPIVNCKKCGVVPVPEKDLPVKLPDKVKFGKGNPLESATSWIKVKCPKCKAMASRETDTMDTFANSSWYYLRFTDPKNKRKIFDEKKAQYWTPIDMYIGGKEHACMHDIYFRFYHKFLRDLGLLKTDEPAVKLFVQGMIHGEDGNKMSKSIGNVVDPLEMIQKYGADALRLFLISVASPESNFNWSDKGLFGSYKFVKKFFESFEKIEIGKSSAKLESKINKTIIEVTKDVENLKFNLAVIKLRSLLNIFNEEEKVGKKDLESFLKMMALFCPHLSEELWSGLGNKGFIAVEKWLVANEKKIDKKFEKEDEAVEKLKSDINNIQKILNKESAKVYVYVMPFELELYQNIPGINVYAVNDKKKYDPENKSKKAKPGKPGIYLE
jgi:leucyl-tRNA synthetase